MTRQWRPKKDPWLPPDHDEHVVYAVRALRAGVASDSQQKLLWDYLAYIGGVGDEWQDLTYRPGANGDRDTTFASGKQFPILQLRKLCRPEYTPTEADAASQSNPKRKRGKR